MYLIWLKAATVTFYLVAALAVGLLSLSHLSSVYISAPS